MDLFVYGTLRSAALMRAVAGPGSMSSVPAVLKGYQVCPVRGDVVPFVTPAPGAVAEGLIWSDLSPAQIARLDAYEGAFGYGLEGVIVGTDNGDRPVRCYMPPTGIAEGPGGWSLAAWEADHLAPAVLAAKALFDYDPLPDHAAIRRMWPMIEKRAWSRHRAMAAPATLRHTPVADDVHVAATQPPAGGFFRFQGFDVAHRTFAGGMSDVLHREVMIGVDAALVLPYDPVRDRVLLVEQLRTGPLMRGDPNPWTLEPVAGMVDARETPQEAALRETQEEAGLTLRHLEPVSQHYASPGGATDYFYTYIGLCDLPRTESYTGGLDDEAEDLRLHVLTFDAALALADSGEITVGPLVLMLNWLARHRDRFRDAG